MMKKAQKERSLHSFRSTALPLLLRAGVAVAGVSVLAGAVWGIEAYRVRKALAAADAHLRAGFGALAAEAVEPARHALTRNAPGCQVVIASYFSARRAERLEWASQACLSNGIEIADSYIGLAASREFTGRDPEAARILEEGAQKLESSSDIRYRLAHVLKRLKRQEDAVTAILKAAELAPNDAQRSFEAVQALSEAGRWAEARPLVTRLREAKTSDPEAKLILARVLLNSGDAEGGGTLVAQARELLASARPDARSDLQRRYPDVLEGSVGGSPGGSKDARRPAASGRPSSPGARTRP